MAAHGGFMRACGGGGLRRALALCLACSAWAGELAAGAIDDRVREHVAAAVAGGIEPSDFHHLVFAFAWRETLADWTAAEANLERLEREAAIDPLMRDELRLLRARLQLDRGRDAAARELFRAMGGLEAWWFFGPQPLDELADFERAAVPPPFDAAWRPVPGTDPIGWVGLAGLAWPPQRQMAYLATTVESAVEQPVAVRVGAAQVARVWVNGREVLTTARPLEQAEDQAAAGAWLRSGSNSVVVAVASEDRRWWLRLRLTRPDGSALEGARELDARPLAVTAPDREPPPVRSLEAEIRAAVAAAEPGSALALAAYLVQRRPQAVGSGGTRSACRAAHSEGPGEARLLEWLATTEAAAARELLAAAVEADPELLWARLELARWYGERGLFDEARALLEPSRSDGPAAAALAYELDGELWGPLSLPGLAELAAASPRSVAANLALAELAERSRRWDLVGEAEARLAALVPGLEEVTELRLRRAASCGDGAALRALVDEVVRRDPNLTGARLRLARLLAADDDPAAARAVVEAGLARSPADIELILELARLENEGGNHERVAELAHEVLAIRPQERRAQRLLELQGEAPEELGWLRSPEELRRLADGAAAAEPAVVVLDHREIRFLPSHLTEERVQLAVLVTAAARAGDLATHTLAFVPEAERLRVLRARILRGDGAVAAARIGDTPRLAEPEFNLYYDTRLRVLRFPELEDGDLIEIAYIRTETEEANETGPYNGGLVLFDRPLPTAVVELELAGPEALMPSWELVGLDGRPETRTDEAGAVHLVWRWRDLPGVPADMPPAPRLAVAPHLVYSNHPEWGDLADWYSRHVEPRVRASDEVVELAQRLVEGRDDRRERIERLYHFVTNEIRYVGLEFGEHRFRPFSADWVLHHRIGDCKDKAALLVALAEAIGVPARMVMVRTAAEGPVRSRLAVLEIFNHAIAYLPEDDLWLDGTASGHALVPPPGPDQNAVVLVVDGPGSRLATSPAVGVGLTRVRYQLSRRDGDGLSITVRSDDTGDGADLRRARFAGSRDPQRFARWLQEQFPGAQLEGEPKLQVIPGRDPTIVELRGSLPRTALASGGGVRTYPGRLQWSASSVPGGSRHGPLIVAAQPDLEWALEVELGRPPRELPPPVELATDFGSLRVELAASDSGYRVSGALRLRPGLVAAADVAAFRDFLLAVERHLERRLETP
ncbi:MAG: DUF3857 and transglutaminase domain-containing protein [Thermoanaerobaculales bacterium]|nr:DUF3857 and transglutaminase domain-containing protein [Thermoanaerobaculales bacterium]